jgi:large subunit ribosomal protein L23
MSKLGQTIKTNDSVIKGAVVTEKSAMVAGANISVYTFEVAREATKPMIIAAIKAKYQVTPKQVNIINVPRRRVVVRGKRGVRSGMKKALVFLKAGDKIEVI